MIDNTRLVSEFGVQYRPYRDGTIAIRPDCTTSHGGWTVGWRWIACMNACSVSAPPSLDPPAEYPQYNKGRGYYAVFFADADGLKLECVYTPPPSG
jgi:hypothetical protein